ncbi:hypothetical protein E4U09_002053 [Claviceps aff. purpurea]|uniref:Uncharacterized protein n=1 Tax=Claviceps aff. purpurea TaxID=1967640 RepID=A0A9P7QG96_9HYPO|nr:hypothetical protein E4U09_002053 [Claviceps aff. purpurea]
MTRNSIFQPIRTCYSQRLSNGPKPARKRHRLDVTSAALTQNLIQRSPTEIIAPIHRSDQSLIIRNLLPVCNLRVVHKEGLQISRIPHEMLQLNYPNPPSR